MSPYKKYYNKPFKVLVAIVTLVAFLFSTVSYDLARAVPSSELKKLNTETFTLPEYLGSVKDYSKGSSGKTIIHIQDAHCNYAAQQKISEIIEYLNKEYGIDTINLEGGAKGYDLSIFTGIDDKTVRGKAVDYFVRQGLVNGAEYFAINNPEKITLWGMEDARLYVDNLNLYRASLQYKDEVDSHLKALTHILNNLKTKIYSRELLELDISYSQYKAGSLTLKDYLAGLIQTVERDAVDIRAFTNIYLLNQVFGEEGGIDFKKANSERDDLIDKLQKKASKRSLEDLVVKTVEFRTEKISQEDFYLYLIGKAKLLGVDLRDFPDLQKYITYISTYEAIDKTKTMKEMDKLESRVRESLYRNDKERELSELSKNLAVLKNIFNVTLTKEDYRYYLDNEVSFKAVNYISFINREAPLYKIAVQLDEKIANLDRYRENIAGFYECSFKRDEAFLKNIRFGKDQRVTVVITGGFHTENLCEAFKKEKISYVSIMPAFKNRDGYESQYFKILSGENVLNIKEALPVVLNSTLAVPSQLNTGITKEVDQFAMKPPDITVKPAVSAPKNPTKWNIRKNIVILVLAIGLFFNLIFSFSPSASAGDLVSALTNRTDITAVEGAKLSYFGDRPSHFEILSLSLSNEPKSDAKNPEVNEIDDGVFRGADLKWSKKIGPLETVTKEVRIGGMEGDIYKLPDIEKSLEPSPVLTYSGTKEKVSVSGKWYTETEFRAYLSEINVKERIKQGTKFIKFDGSSDMVGLGYSSQVARQVWKNLLAGGGIGMQLMVGSNNSEPDRPKRIYDIPTPEIWGGLNYENGKFTAWYVNEYRLAPDSQNQTDWNLSPYSHTVGVRYTSHLHDYTTKVEGTFKKDNKGNTAGLGGELKDKNNNIFFVNYNDFRSTLPLFQDKKNLDIGFVKSIKFGDNEGLLMLGYNMIKEGNRNNHTVSVNIRIPLGKRSSKKENFKRMPTTLSDVNRAANVGNNWVSPYQSVYYSGANGQSSVDSMIFNNGTYKDFKTEFDSLSKGDKILVATFIAAKMNQYYEGQYNDVISLSPTPIDIMTLEEMYEMMRNNYVNDKDTKIGNCRNVAHLVASLLDNGGDMRAYPVVVLGGTHQVVAASASDGSMTIIDYGNSYSQSSGNFELMLDVYEASNKNPGSLLHHIFSSEGEYLVEEWTPIGELFKKYVLEEGARDEADFMNRASNVLSQKAAQKNIIDILEKMRDIAGRVQDKKLPIITNIDENELKSVKEAPAPKTEPSIKTESNIKDIGMRSAITPEPAEEAPVSISIDEKPTASETESIPDKVTPVTFKENETSILLADISPISDPFNKDNDVAVVRRATAVEGLISSEGRDNDVRVVVGIVKGSKRNGLQFALSRGLAENGFGRIDDIRQVVTFEIDGEETEKNLEDAMGKEALEGLSPNGRVVLFAPQMKNGPQLAKKYKGRTNVIVVSDAYTDLSPEKNSYPDIMVRVAVGRKIAFYYTGGEKDDTLKEIKDLLENIADNDLAGAGDLNDLLKKLNEEALRIKPVDYMSFKKYQEYQKLAATSV